MSYLYKEAFEIYKYGQYYLNNYLISVFFIVF